MKQYQVSNAYETICMLSEFKLPVSASYSLYTLAKKLEPTQMFVDHKKRELLEEYHGSCDASGYAHFPTKDEESAFVAAINELANLDIEIDFKPVNIPMNCLNDAKLSISDISRLNGFVNFTEV